ncbi:APC family permease [Pseudalkalibacillus sp. A8]|uniref:APC family permease n=1 Tax=Pseudalkalibacillus sp. A8 TaxID=3382641 RepID=UPI0038B57D3E
MEERTQLEKTLKPHWVLAIAFGSAVGWGCFVLPVDWLTKAGPFGAIIGFSVGALLMIVIAVSYGILINRFPVSGGEFAYAYLGFGRKHAYIGGWFLALGYICIVALNASALALLGKFVLPGIVKQGLMYNIAGWDVYFGEVSIASIALLLFAYLNIRGASISGKAQFVCCVLLVLGVLLIAGSMFLHPSVSFSNLQPSFKPGVSAWSAIIAIVAIAPWAYVGFDNVPQAAEEFSFSPKKAFKLIVLSLICAAVVYSLMILATAVAMPWQELVHQQSIWGTGDAISGLLGNSGVILLTISVCMGVFTGLNGFYVSASRLLFAMGRAHILPKSFSKLHSKYKTPYVGIVFTCIICLFAPWFGRQALLWVVDMSAIGVTIAYFYCCLVAFKCLKWNSEQKSGDLEDVAPVKKGLTLLGTISSVVFLGLLVVPGSPAFLGIPSWVALFVWVVLGTIVYLSRSKELNQIPEERLDYLILGKSGFRKENRSQSSDLYPPKVDVN